jgi:hypothetical protein
MGHPKNEMRNKEKRDDYADFRTVVSTSEFDFFRSGSRLTLLLVCSFRRRRSIAQENKIDLKLQNYQF